MNHINFENDLRSPCGASNFFESVISTGFKNPDGDDVFVTFLKGLPLPYGVFVSFMTLYCHRRNYDQYLDSKVLDQFEENVFSWFRDIDIPVKYLIETVPELKETYQKYDIASVDDFRTVIDKAAKARISFSSYRKICLGDYKFVYPLYKFFTRTFIDTMVEKNMRESLKNMIREIDDEYQNFIDDCPVKVA